MTGCLAALGRFLSKSGDKCQYFFKAIKKSAKFERSEEAEAAFIKLKEHLNSLLRLVSPMEGETLYMYLSVSDHALSAVLVAEREGAQLPVYFVSHVLQGAEMRYATFEKYGLALMMASKKLRPYFAAHKIVIYTDQPIKQPLTKLESSGRMLKWVIALNGFNLEFEPRKAIKGQALADFIVEMTRPPPVETSSDIWTLFVDGSSTQNGCGAGILFKSPEGDIFEYAMRFKFQTSNNEAEYEALVAGIRMCKAAGAIKIDAMSDSQLVVS